jgi:hypothetical protein
MKKGANSLNTAYSKRCSTNMVIGYTNGRKNVGQRSFEIFSTGVFRLLSEFIAFDKNKKK